MAEHALQLRPARSRTENISKVARQLRALTRQTKTTVASRRYAGGLGRGAGVFRMPSARMQRVVVKVSYAKNTATRSWAAHGKYLQRENAKEHGKKGAGFNESRSDIDIQSTLQEWQQADDKHFFKVILAPDQGNKLDLVLHSRALMQQVQRDLGTTLQWMAIDHNNTDHTHVHLLIRGVDGAGKALMLDPVYISEGFRSRSQELVTRSLGLRTQQDISLTRKRQIDKPRVTEIDRSLRFKAKDNVISFENRVPQRALSRERRLQEIARLKYLESLGLVTQVAPKMWRLHDNLETTLRAMQLSGDIIKSRAQHHRPVESLQEALSPTIVTEKEPIIGRVVGVGLEDELHDRRYLLVEGLDGKVHYIRATNGIVKARDTRQFSNGDVISLQEKFFVSKEGKKVSYIKVTNYQSIDGLLVSPEPIFDEYIIGLVKTQKGLLNSLDTQPEFLKNSITAMNLRVNELVEEHVLVKKDNKFTVAEDYQERLVNSQHVRFGQYTSWKADATSISLAGEVVASNEEKLLIRDVRGGYYQVLTKDLGDIKPLLVGQSVHLQASENKDYSHENSLKTHVICKVLNKSSHQPDPLSPSLTKLDQLLVTIGLPSDSEKTWLAERMRSQVRVWESRGIAVSKEAKDVNEFNQQAQRWLLQEHTLEKVQARYSLPLTIIEDTARREYKGEVVGVGSMDKSGKSYLVLKSKHSLQAFRLPNEQLREYKLQQKVTVAFHYRDLDMAHPLARDAKVNRTIKRKND